MHPNLLHGNVVVGTANQLTSKQTAFVREYLVDRNATQAAIRAGYSARTAASIGEENLRKPDIADAIAAGTKVQERRAIITRDRVVEKLAEQFEVAAKPADQNTKAASNPSLMLRSAELLAKLHGWVVERRDVRVIRSIRDLTSEELDALEAEAASHSSVRHH